MLTAITGGIAEGKSTVLSILSDMGYKTLSADASARELFDDPDVNRQLAEAAGVRGGIGPLDLRRAISGDPAVRRSVNRIMHPLVMNRIRSQQADFVEIPLLLEACLQGQFECIWVVTCGIGEQMNRLALRYGDRSEAEALIATQLRTTAKIPFADVVLRTNCPLEAVRRHISVALASRFE